MKRKKPRFLRQDWSHLSLLGRRRKKKQKWRKPKGRHSKLREKRKGHGKHPSVGYGSAKETRKKIDNLMPRIVHNIQELQQIKKGEIAVIAKIGMKKKYEIAKKALHASVRIANLDAKKFIEDVEKELAKRREEKKKKVVEEKKKKTEKKEEKGKSELEKEVEKEKKEEKEIEEEKKTLMKTEEEVQQEKHVKFKDKKLIERVALEK